MLKDFVFHLCNLGELFIRDPGANRFPQQRINPCHRMILHVSLIQPERELVHIPLQMLFAEGVIRPIKSTFQDSPDTLNAICMRHAVHEFLGAMVHYGMEVVLRHSLIGKMFVSAEAGGRGDTFDDLPLNFIRPGVLENLPLDPTAAFPHSQDGNLADRSTSSLQLLRFVLVALLAAKVGFIGFDDPTEKAILVVIVMLLTAGFADALKKEPGG